MGFVDALVVAPHPDDAEIAMGGTISLLEKEGKKVCVLDLTNGEPTPYGTPEIRASETLAASRILKISLRRNLGLKNREVEDSIENRKLLAGVIRELKPALLFIPYWEDTHPDHVAASKLCESARFYSKFVKSDISHQPWYPRKVIHFFSTHLRVRFNPTFVVDVSSEIEAKMAAIEAYRSQFVTHQANSHILEAIRNESAYWGFMIGAKFGEPFVCRENIKINVQNLLEI
jgi:bacillithiol biosynthesis deacetylase BshB1